MRILAVGGGSGGHVTPVVAVLREIEKQKPGAEIRFWCDQKFAPQARGIIRHFNDELPVQVIIAGKLRRYHHLKAWQHFTIPSVFWPNLRDIFLVIIGFIQSFFKLIFWRPDVIFTKGGFVCLPVGVAAKLLNIPLVVHDSDSHPGLTNRILSRWAVAIATGAPLNNYPYPPAISKHVGVPIAADFHPFTEEERAALKHQLGFNPKKPLVVVTGGGLGAKNINDAVAKRLNELLEGSSVMLLSGNDHYDEMRATTPESDPRFQLHAFIDHDMAKVFGAADIVVTRAGATALLELAALAKPTVLVPNGRLTAGHQLKNAAEYAKNGAVEVINEEELVANPQLLVDTLTSLLSNKARLKEMSKLFYAFAKPDAAKETAEMVLSAVK